MRRIGIELGPVADQPGELADFRRPQLRRSVGTGFPLHCEIADVIGESPPRPGKSLAGERLQPTRADTPDGPGQG